jgi:glycine C-acetyltransferase
MDGDVCRLPELVELTRRHGGRLLVDEAHALGTLGPDGKGTEDHFGMPGAADLLVGTLSKAPGGLGGYVAGSHELIEYLRHFANSYVFSTALPPPVAAGLIAAFDVIEHDAARRQRLADNARYFVEKLRAQGFETGPTQTPIVPVLFGDEVLVRKVALELNDAGIFASPVVYPAVLRGQGRIRFGVMATHTRDDLDQVVAALVVIRERHAKRG